MYAARLVGIDVFDTSLGANDYVFGPFSTQQLLMKHASALAARAPTTLRPWPRLRQAYQPRLHTATLQV